MPSFIHQAIVLCAYRFSLVRNGWIMNYECIILFLFGWQAGLIRLSSRRRAAAQSPMSISTLIPRQSLHDALTPSCAR